MGTYCQVFTSKWLVCCESARRARGARMGQELLSQNSIDSRWTFSLKSGNVPSVPGSPVLSSPVPSRFHPKAALGLRSGPPALWVTVKEVFPVLALEVRILSCPPNSQRVHRHD